MSGSALTDWNDLLVTAGPAEVRRQLSLAAVNDDLQASPVDDPGAPFDEFYDDDYVPSHAHPDSGAAGKFGRWNIYDMLRHVSLIYGTDTVWDDRERIQMRLSHFGHIVGRDLFKEWANHPGRKIIKGLVFEPSGDVPAHHVNLFDGFPIAPDTHGARSGRLQFLYFFNPLPSVAVLCL